MLKETFLTGNDINDIDVRLQAGLAARLNQKIKEARGA
jgi:hypothetical protein